jgi:hydroxylaminobenzene mutase
VLQESRSLLQLGVLLLLLAVVIGFAIPALAVPRLGVAAHVNAVVGAVFLIVLGLVWPQLRLGPRALRIVFWLAVYSFFMGVLMPLLGGVWGAGATMLPIAAGTARGSAFQEGVIATGLSTAGVGVIALCVLLLLGLRTPAREP